MIKKLLLSVFIVASVSSQAQAMKNWEIESTSYGTDYRYWCEDGRLIQFSIGHNMPVRSTLGYETIGEYLASIDCL